MRLMAVMLVFVPISLALHVLNAPAPWVFATACLAVIPLAGFLGRATNELALRYGPGVGGLLTATFGNATEIIFAMVAVHAGEVEVVKASLIGSIIGNILLVLGLSVFLGGIRHKVQRFSVDVALAHATMLGMAVVGLLVPALFVRNLHGISELVSNPRVAHLSTGIAVVLLLVYIGGLVFSLYTHEDLFRGDLNNRHEAAVWPRSMAALTLAAATVFIAMESELLVAGIEPVAARWRLSRLFIGVIVIPIIGNAAEHSTAILMALQNRIEVSLNIAVSSSTQIAMLAIPVIILLSGTLGHPITVLFSPFELVALTASAVIAVLISMDGKSHWLEGAQLLATWVVVALAFYYIAV
ncbi:MAG: calcium/proton exchanger [Armatimonadetes bacterium]|nr:calcium/proton exchanger [Armatimonadota bacterium]MDE2205922.1 calcium/proton exchanger [Armatimonadota bacterium]